LIVYVPDNCLDKPLRIAGFSRDPNVDSDNGLPYYDKNRKKMLDLICSKEMTYYEAKIGSNSFNLLSPTKLLESYEDRFEDLNKSDVVIENKIKFLQQILSCINPTSIKTYKKPTKKENYDTDAAPPLFWDDDDNVDNVDNNNEEMPMRQPSFGDDE
jgi:hypothetical protein